MVEVIREDMSPASSSWAETRRLSMINTRPALCQRQQLSPSPRLYQRLKILSSSSAGVHKLVQQQINENPLLEMSEPAGPEDGLPGRELWEDYIRVEFHRPGAARETALQSPADLAASPVSLADHLTLQLNLRRLTKEKHRIGMVIIGSLDDGGYLREPVAEVAQSANASGKEVEAILAIIQRFDPPGVAARSLEECLLIQLDQLERRQDSDLAANIVKESLSQVGRSALPGIARELGVRLSQVEKAVALIRSLNPAPGSLFDINPSAAPVIPDVYIGRQHGRIQVLAGRETLPRLKLDSYYQKMAFSSKDVKTSQYLKTKIKEATNLIKDVEQRGAMVTNVARAIAAAQADFFTGGPALLKPLHLEDIASRLGVHPSTISRAVADKYASTPYGIFELRYFFSGGYLTGGGNELAATAVKKQLRQLIAGEDKRRPHSDQKLAGLLKNNSISISRRTVAKYRGEARIPPSWQRKKKAAC